MGKCITVQLSDGSYQRVQVADGVTKLPKSDLEQLELWVAYVKAKYAKKRKAVPKDSKGGEG